VTIVYVMEILLSLFGAGSFVLCLWCSILCCATGRHNDSSTSHNDGVDVSSWKPSQLELMIMGMGFPFLLGIPWESHGNENWWLNLEWEWEGMGITLYGNGNGPYSHWNKFPSGDAVFILCSITEWWFLFWLY